MAAKSVKNLQRAQCSNLLQSLPSFTSINAMYVNWMELIPLMCLSAALEEDKRQWAKVSQE